jgi:uncharacterized protein (TIGR02996 family)
VQSTLQCSSPDPTGPTAMEDVFLQAIHADPADATAWLALADWLEETSQDARAELLRLRESLRRQIKVRDRPTLEARLQRLLLEGVRPVAALLTVELAEQVELTLSLIPPGIFQMGSSVHEKDRFSNEGPRHQVTITRPFYLGVYPVTQAQWLAVMQNKPSACVDEQRPVEQVNWHECQEFCKRLGERLGRVVRLPYEAEWEYACRAGTASAYCTGNGVEALKRAGWCSYRGHTGSACQTQPVGEFAPNAFGLYDMHGNVCEWCQDGLRTYVRQPQVDPRGDESGDYRVVRGGSWYYGPADSRSACRYHRPVVYRLDYYGLRIAMPCA